MLVQIWLVPPDARDTQARVDVAPVLNVSTIPWPGPVAVSGPAMAHLDVHYRYISPGHMQQQQRMNNHDLQKLVPACASLICGAHRREQFARIKSRTCAEVLAFKAKVSHFVSVGTTRGFTVANVWTERS